MFENGDRNNEFDENRDENIEDEKYREEIFEESDLVTPNMETEQSSTDLGTGYQGMKQNSADSETASQERKTMRTENAGETKYSYVASNMQGTWNQAEKMNKKHKKKYESLCKSSVLCHFIWSSIRWHGFGIICYW